MNASDPEEPEINPRTGLPYKQSAKLREQKRQWALKNPDAINKHVRAWQESNRDRMYAWQRAYHQRKREEHKYLLELFSEGVGDMEVNL
jgi:hypothetical protein